MVRPWQSIPLLLLGSLWTGLACSKPAAMDRGMDRGMDRSTDRSHDFDRPGDEEDLNREIWQLSGRKNYGQVVAKLRRDKKRFAVDPVLPLPNGWRLAPAGHQIGVGRLPYEALIYQGRLVVINSGYTGKDPQTLSVLQRGTGRLEQTIPLQNLYPSGAAGLDGDLYLSGGFGRDILRLDRTFQLRRRYPIGGYGGPIAALDAHHLVVGYLQAPRGTSKVDGAGRLVVLNTESGQVETESSGLLFPSSLHVLSGKIYVTTLGINASTALIAICIP
jgi:hypothetical protein